MLKKDVDIKIHIILYSSYRLGGNKNINTMREWEMKIKNIEFNSDLIGYEVELEDGRIFYAQAEKESNRLHADFGTYSLCSYEPADADNFLEEETVAIMTHLNSLSEVKEWLESLENLSE